jgi:hypothetical protein
MRTGRVLGIAAGVVALVALAAAGGAVYWRHLQRRIAYAPFGTSLCESDWDCPGPLYCKEMKLASEGAVRMGRLCRVRGIGREGEACRSNTHDLREACIEALRCNYGVCGRGCDPSVPDSCPAGMRCRDEAEPPSCVPSCRGAADCPAGTECAWVDADFAICVGARGERCDVHPCKPGMVCRSLFLPIPQSPIVETRCALPCSKQSPCPDGQFCDEGECAIPCRAGSQDCPPAMVCSEALYPRAEWRCWPEGHPLPMYRQRGAELPALPIEHRKGKRTWFEVPGQ